MDRRPPLAVSPRRLRPRPNRAAAGRPPVACSVQTTPGSMKKASTPMRSSICALPPSSRRLEPSPRAKLDFAFAPSPPRPAPGKENLHHAHHDEPAVALAAASVDNNWMAAAPTSPLFQRGRLYDLYSARRNERLKRKHGLFTASEAEAAAMGEDPCVAVELSKQRRGAAKKGAESSVRQSLPAGADFSVSRANLRSSLRSSKEMKKASFAGGKSSVCKERRAGSRSSARMF